MFLKENLDLMEKASDLIKHHFFMKITYKMLKENAWENKLYFSINYLGIKSSRQVFSVGLWKM